NPFAWQVLFVFGAWCALGGARKNLHIINAPVTVNLCIAYLVFALIMTMAGKFPAFGDLFPHWLYSTFNPNDKTNLAPYRFLYFVAHFELSMSSGSLLAQIFVSVTGIAIMTIVAYYISWSKRKDKPLKPPAPKPA